MKKYFYRILKLEFYLKYSQNIKNNQIKTSMSKIIAGKTADIAPGKMIKVTIDGRDILVANINGDYCATDDSCTHSGSSLSEGKLDGCTITCGWHAAEFDCKTGKLVKFPAKIRDLTSYNVVVESDNVFIEM
jgi:nitrite reductase/ring-hydroxylating ferredoxin subunit